MKIVIRLFFILIPLSFSQLNLNVQVDSIPVFVSDSLLSDSTKTPISAPKTRHIRESKRIVAIALCLTLGPFGMHRLYLGTEPQVPATYAVTLGGGLGALAVIDLLHLVFSKDIERYKNNPRVIMWAK